MNCGHEDTVTVTTITLTPPDDWEPPFPTFAEDEGFRRVSKSEALWHDRPHRCIVRGGRYDGYEEWFVSDSPCGCPFHGEDAR